MNSSPQAYDYDVAVIGGGSAGYAAARSAAQFGLGTVLIEGAKELGGLCILRGCMPTKTLLYATEVLHQTEHADAFGIRTRGVQVDFAALMARKDRLIQDFADDRRKQLSSGAFSFIRAAARFSDAHTVQLSTGSKLTARYFILATGSIVAPPPVAILADLDYLTSDTALELTELPQSLIVLGGGAVAVEFAQFFVRLGVKVTMIQRSSQLLHEIDNDAAAVLQKVFRREGITLYLGTQLKDARRQGNQKKVWFEYQGKPIEAAAQEVFFALGRIPNTAQLGLERTSVQTDHGHIITDDAMRTAAPHIFAAGDCTGWHEIVHVAIQQAEVAAYNIAHPANTRHFDCRLFTSVIFTDPQIACVGLTEKNAQARQIPYQAAFYPFNDHGKSMIMESLDGFVKLLADPRSGEILGASCIGPFGGELIHEIIVAMAKRMTVHELATLPHYHPTLAEIWTYPAEELAQQIHPTTVNREK